MALQDQIWDALDDILIALSTNKSLVDRAYKAFKKQADQFYGHIDDTVFNEWFMHNYLNDLDSSALAPNSLAQDNSLVDAIANARLSLYTIFMNKQYVVFEDVFTKSQYPIHRDHVGTDFDDKSMYLTRIYTWRGDHCPSPTYQQLPLDVKSLLVKEVMQQYQSAKALGAYTIEGFLIDTPLLLYWAVGTLEAIEEDVEQDLVVFELTCAIEDQPAFEKFLKHESVRLTTLEGVYSFVIEAEELADFVIEGQRVVFDCSHAEAAEKVKEEIEKSNWGLVTLEMRELHIDDLVGDQE